MLLIKHYDMWFNKLSYLIAMKRYTKSASITHRDLEKVGERELSRRSRLSPHAVKACMHQESLPLISQYQKYHYTLCLSLQKFA